MHLLDPLARTRRRGAVALLPLILAAGCTRGRVAVPPQTMRSSDSIPVQRGHAAVRGIRMYYEIHGEGDGAPLLLLHGGGSTIEVTWARILPLLAEGRRVIAIEDRGHGRSSDRPEPYSFESSADDVAALLEALDVERADLFGFSNGASTALQVAIRHPERLRRLVFASAVTRRDGADPQLWEWMEQATFETMPQPLKDAFLEVNPDPGQLRRMHDGDAERMRGFRDVPDDAVRAVRAPTLVVVGDRDVVKPEHALELVRLFPQARLLVLPGGHGDYLGEALSDPSGGSQYPRLTAGLIEAFLDAP